MTDEPEQKWCRCGDAIVDFDCPVCGQCIECCYDDWTHDTPGVQGVQA